jgi:hypothetical protein
LTYVDLVIGQAVGVHNLVECGVRTYRQGEECVPGLRDVYHPTGWWAARWAGWGGSRWWHVYDLSRVNGRVWQAIDMY